MLLHKRKPNPAKRHASLSELGDRQGALAPAREAVEIRRELAARAPDAFRPDLAASLNNLAIRLSELGDRQGALKPAREAVAIYRELAARHPDAFRPALASSLNNLATFLSALGDRPLGQNSCRCAKKTKRLWLCSHAVSMMRAGPSVSPIRRRHQTTLSCRC